MRLLLIVLSISFSLAAQAVTGTLENPQPGTRTSGIGLISGWVCQATAIQAKIDGGTPITIPYGGARADTASVCGRSDTGFGLLFNYNTLGDGSHTIELLADGQSVGSATFTVVTLGSEFISGLSGGTSLINFPSQGKRTLLQWQQAIQNFGIIIQDSVTPDLAGAYGGGLAPQQTSCILNNGGGTASGVAVSITTSGSTLTMNANYDGGATCAFIGNVLFQYGTGFYSVPTGNYSCSPGGAGTWSTTTLQPTLTGITGAISYQFTNGCAGTANLGAARLP